MDFPSALKYTKDHEWVKIEGDHATVGITAYAIEQLGDIVFVELPAVGTEFDEASPFGTVESTKTVSDLYMPLTGKVEATNAAIVEAPESLQNDPYEAGWLVKVKLKSPGASGELLSAAEYQKFISE
ncbi:MAG: glycine cleavage system protein GcvH [Oligoflexales bacterium]|nr:glycine cleavage system protein GcvH [Oligoflexales bacterium]